MNLSGDDKRIVQQFFSHKPVKRAYVFGSYARNEADKESDIDILVELDHSQPIGMKFFGYQVELEKLLNKKIDLVTSGGLSEYLKPVIDHDKILIYERATN